MKIHNFCRGFTKGTAIKTRPDCFGFTCPASQPHKGLKIVKRSIENRNAYIINQNVHYNLNRAQGPQTPDHRPGPTNPQRAQTIANENQYKYDIRGGAPGLNCGPQGLGASPHDSVQWYDVAYQPIGDTYCLRIWQVLFNKHALNYRCGRWIHQQASSRTSSIICAI